MNGVIWIDQKEARIFELDRNDVALARSSMRPVGTFTVTRKRSTCGPGIILTTSTGISTTSRTAWKAAATFFSSARPRRSFTSSDTCTTTIVSSRRRLWVSNPQIIQLTANSSPICGATSTTRRPNDMSWRAPEKAVDAGTARRGILHQHARLRQLLARANAVAEARLAGDTSVPDAVASAIADVRSAIEVHLVFEEATLIPLFREDLPSGRRPGRAAGRGAHSAAGDVGSASRGSRPPSRASHARRQARSAHQMAAGRHGRGRAFVAESVTVRSCDSATRWRREAPRA